MGLPGIPRGGKGQGTILVYVDADAISFQPKPGDSIKVEGVLVKSNTQLTSGANTVERLPCKGYQNLPIARPTGCAQGITSYIILFIKTW